MASVAKPEGSFDQLDQFIKEEAKGNSGLVLFAAVNNFINRFSWGFFVVDNDPVHQELHPVDEHLLSLETNGKITINYQEEHIRVTGECSTS